ncbi:hypothetical protein ENKO_466 [Klebsiella phage fENko-Kae01]|nr:hypothetical protein [Klebsiella phage fENko-Kae01]
MTTIYVNHKLGVVMTDTRTTTTVQETFLGIPIATYDTFNDDGVKAINVHDRIFVESGSCEESTKILQYLAHGTPIKPAPKKYKLLSNCFLVDKNWLLQIYIQKGKVHKRFHVVKEDSWYCTGSGSNALYEALKVYDFKPTLEEAISAFKTVHFSDRFTSNQVLIYKI